MRYKYYKGWYEPAPQWVTERQAEYLLLAFFLFILILIKVNG